MSMHSRPANPDTVERPSLLLAAGTACAALVVAIVGLIWRNASYGSETHQLSDAAVAQDLVTALLALPLLAFLIRGVARGSGRSLLLGLGVLSFLAYNYAIYCFSITFGFLFLPWTALLGLTSLLLVAGFVRANAMRLDTVVRPSRTAAITLCGVATLFAALWLSQILPDIVEGDGSSSAREWQVPTNPVHVLDLAFALPAAAAAGLFLYKQRRWALILAPIMLTFFVLTSIPIIVTPVVQEARSHAATWAAAAPVAMIAAVSAFALFKVLARAPSDGDRTARPQARATRARS